MHSTDRWLWSRAVGRRPEAAGTGSQTEPEPEPEPEPELEPEHELEPRSADPEPPVRVRGVSGSARGLVSPDMVSPSLTATAVAALAWPFMLGMAFMAYMYGNT